MNGSAIVNPAGSEEQPTIARRLPASAVPSIKAVRLSPYGADATLVNISSTGVLVQCDRRLKPLSSVTVLIDGGFQPATILSKVVRCAVAGIGGDGTLHYHVGIAFGAPIRLEDPPEPAPEPAAEQPAPERLFTPPAPVLRNRW